MQLLDVLSLLTRDPFVSILLTFHDLELRFKTIVSYALMLVLIVGVP